MTMLVTDNTWRFCSRCRHPLTDPASREAGVGPICRGRDNYLLAKTIQANIPAASAVVLGTTAEDFPEPVRERWTQFSRKFMHQMDRAESSSSLSYTGADFRDCVRDIDYMLSFHMRENMRKRLIGIVKNLGYVGLSAVLSREASLSKAKLWFENGRVYMDGRSCKPGWLKMRRIPGVHTPRYRGHRVPYSAPAAYVEDFLNVVVEHWPLHEDKIEQIKDEAADFIKNNPNVPSATPVQDENIACITMKPTSFDVNFPWIPDAPMWDMINAIKAIPYRERKYNPNTKTWTCNLARLQEVKQALLKVFPKEAIKVKRNA